MKKPTLLRMRKLLTCCLLLLGATPAFPADWKLVWSDEFEKPGLPDPAKWDYEVGFIRNDEQQYYTRNRTENARIENGIDRKSVV